MLSIIFLFLRPFLPYLAVAITALGMILSVYRHGVTTEKNKEAMLALKGVEKHGKISKDVMSLSDADLDKRLQRWYRD